MTTFKQMGYFEIIIMYNRKKKYSENTYIAQYDQNIEKK